MSLIPVDPTNEVAVTSYLSQARDWLSRAVDETGPEQIARAKAEIATAAEATKQLGLSKEIREDAAEMVRRAEWALRRATKKAQEAGEVKARGADLIPGARTGSHAPTSSSGLPSPKSFFNSQSEYEDANAMGELGPEQFDDVIAEARAEGNLSRANVARKAREASAGATPAPRRRSLPDTARDAGWDLRKSVERLQRIADDDRFATNKQQVAPLLRSHLENAVEVCQDLLARINNN